MRRREEPKRHEPAAETNGELSQDDEAKNHKANSPPRRVIIFMVLISYLVTLCMFALKENHNLIGNVSEHTTATSNTKYAKMETQLMQYFDKISAAQASPKISPTINELISLRLGGHQAGFGNILIGVFAVFMEAFVSDKFPILNNCIILSMYEHPNPQLSFLNHGGKTGEKCQFNEQQLSKYSPNPDKKHKGKQVNNQAVVSDMKSDGVLKKYSNMLQLEETDMRLYDIVSSTMAKWIMQRPTPLFQRLVNERKKQVMSQCNTDGIHFGIQIRTWRDFDYGHGQYYEAVYADIVDCIKNWLNKQLKDSNLRSRACLYITSDDPVETKRLVASLTDVNDRLTFATAVPTSQDTWHTDESFKAGKSNFDPQNLNNHEELIDWYIFGEANAAIYTLGGTYGRTARMRRGYSSQANDFVVGRKNASDKFTCHAVQDYDSEIFKGWYASGSLEAVHGK